MTTRQLEINAWLHSLFPEIDLTNLQYMQSDASQRKYLRLKIKNNSFIIMDTLPGPEISNFITIAKILTRHNITAPEIIHYNMEQGLVLLTDFGSTTYLQALQNANPAQIDKLYLDAITMLVKIQLIPTDDSLGYNLETMDEVYINKQLDVFSTWYLQRHLALELGNDTTALISKLYKLFTAVFKEVPHKFVHVDYHCRNLLATAINSPAVLDFQDAMCGPITYDLVSLLQDAYITWPRSLVESLVNTYKEIAVSAGIIPPISNSTLLRYFDMVGLQRHIKNLGVFARLHHRDNKSAYLKDIPTLLRYINETCERYNELTWLQNFITEAILE